jgi:hypothetical protein
LIERPVKISSTTSYNSSSPLYSLCSSWVFSQPKTSDGAIFGLYGGCGVRSNRETSNFSWVALAL